MMFALLRSWASALQLERQVNEEKKKQFHMAQWVNPDRGEMFFARHVVFVEGETEKVIIPFLAEKMSIFDPDVSVIDCGSKTNLPLYITIAKAFSFRELLVATRNLHRISVFLF